MKKKTKVILITIIIVIAVLVTTLISIINKIEADVEVIFNEDITEVDLSLIEDSVYQGEYKKSSSVSAEVEVTIQNGKISDIKIINHTYGKGEPAEVIIEDIIEYQSLLVDDISGATYSSKVLKLSVQDALEE